MIILHSQSQYYALLGLSIVWSLLCYCVMARIAVVSLWRNSRFVIHFVYRAPTGITILSKPDQIYWVFDFALETGSEMCRAAGSTPVSWQLRNNQWKIQKWLHNAVRHKTDQVSRETSNSHPMYLQIRRHVRSNIHRHKSHSIIVCVYQVKLWGKFVGATTNFWDWKMAGMNWKKKRLPNTLGVLNITLPR